MLGIAVFDDEKIIVDYVGELIKENLDVNAKIYKYTKLEEFKGDCKKGILQKINAIYIDIILGRNFKNKTNIFIIKTNKKRTNKKSLEKALQEEKQSKNIQY